MKEIRDPRNAYPVVEKTAETYRVTNTVSNCYRLESDTGKTIELIKNWATIELNPLLAEMGLYDHVIIEERVLDAAAAKAFEAGHFTDKLRLIISLRKATQDEIRAFMPNAIFSDPDQSRSFQLASYLEEDLPEVLKTPPAKPAAPSIIDPAVVADPAPILHPVHATAAANKNGVHHHIDLHSSSADSAE